MQVVGAPLITPAGIMSNLFVDEEDFDDDPIVSSLPIVHGSLPAPHSQLLHVLQYTGRPQNRPISDLRATVKPQSRVLELRVPMDTLRFYDEARASELGGVEASALQGVLTETDGGLYVGRIVEVNGQAQLVVHPVDSTAQLRPLFQYLDDSEPAPFKDTDQKPSAVQVLQTLAKAAVADHAAGLGSCLRSVKKFNEEDWMALTWREGDSGTMSMLDAMALAPLEPVGVTTMFDDFA